MVGAIIGRYLCTSVNRPTPSGSLDLRARELRKNGLKIHLPEQSIQILAMLAERPGEVVTREEIRQNLWPDDTIVEFDHSINAAVKRLRQALDDSADNPRFVETLARRGYRLIVPVEGVGGGAGVPPVALEKDRDARYPSALDLRTDLKRLKPDAAGASRPRWRLWAMISAAALVAAGVVAYLFVLPAPQPRIVNSIRITTDGNLKSNILTDGSRLYFVQGSPPGLYQVSASGGDAQALAIPFQSAALLDVSRDGSEFLVQAGAKDQPELLWPLWILPVLGGSPRRIGDVMVFDASWAPDGEHIIYSNADTLYQVRRDGGESRKFVTAPGSPFSLHWSPDGTRLRFSVADPKGGPVSLWEVWADGTHLHPVLPDWKKTANKCCGIWSPDGKYYVFNAAPEGRGDLWAICEKESLLRKCSRDPVQLTAGPWCLPGPVFSRDGKKIFVRTGQRAVELVRYDAKVRRFASYLTGISADGASFSKDGQWVAYVRVPEGTLWRSKVDGSEQLQLTYSPMNAGNPRWTPDGKEIAFQGWAPGKTL
jgi:DNA-binding winged helix-turn-helix (wHTH) protein/dipeptidyl aminopeptidase/acylaminoacyl peptidase